MKTRTAFACLVGVLTTAVSASLSGPATAASPATASRNCAPSGGLNYICGIHRGEDLVVIPGTKWVITSGLGEGGALHLVDATAKSGRRWYPATYGARDVLPPQADLKAYPGCPSAPDAKRFFAHGLSLRPKGPGRYTLYMVNHNGREAIEVFEVNAAQPAPTIRWTGCMLMPKDEPANSVAAAPDGSLLATVLQLPGRTRADVHAGRPTGVVIEWSMAKKTWRRIPNTELSGNNGIETSPDGKEFYVVALGAQQVLAYRRNEPNKAPRVAQLSGFWPDNVRLDSQGRLLTAGGTNPCVDARKAVLPESAPCYRGYVVVAIDPRTMSPKVIAKGPLNANFTGPTIAVTVGRDMWIGTHESDRIAYIPAS
jgi:hypothetical protein